MTRTVHALFVGGPAHGTFRVVQCDFNITEVIEALVLPIPGPLFRRRSWRERFCTRPWKPWVGYVHAALPATRTVPYRWHRFTVGSSGICYNVFVEIDTNPEKAVEFLSMLNNYALAKIVSRQGAFQ